MAQHRMSSEAPQTAAREIGRLTILRLTVYYVMAGILIMCLSALLPLGSIGPIPAEPPADMQGTSLVAAPSLVPAHAEEGR